MGERRLIVITCLILIPALADACRTLDLRGQGRAQPDPEPAYKPPETEEVYYPSKRPQAKEFVRTLGRFERRCVGTHIINGICPDIDTSNLEWGPPLERRTIKKPEN